MGCLNILNKFEQLNSMYTKHFHRKFCLKVCILAFFATLYSTPAFFSTQKMIRKNNEPFVYAAYSAGYTMKDESYVEKMDYSKFNFYYLMCYPKWVVSDFDNSLKDIITKYVTKFNYPNSLSGCGLSTAFIDSVHVAGAKVLLSIQGDSFIEIANDKERRNKFAIMIAQFIRKYDYDGLDLDWEGTLDLDLHYLFMKKVRQELNEETKKKLLFDNRFTFL